MIEIAFSVQSKKWTSLSNFVVEIFNKICSVILTDRSVQKVSSLVNYKQIQIALTLVNDNQIALFNNNFRNKNKPTDVLSLETWMEITPTIFYLGDVIISFETTKKDANEGGIEIKKHISHLLIHSVLHLLGYDHQTDEEAEQMEHLESKFLNIIQKDYEDNSLL